MPMLMLKCKTCGTVFPGIYVQESSSAAERKAAVHGDPLHTCSRGHMNEYVQDDYMDWS